MINLAIIGMGLMGSKYAKMLFENPDLGFKVKACTRVKGENLDRVKEYIDDIKIYQTDEELFKGFDNKEYECDAVLIVTPHMRHEYDACEAFKRNLHVLCDKPAGASLSAGLRMLESSKDLVYGFIFQQRYLHIYNKVKEIIESKVYGNIKRYQATITDWYRTNPYYKSNAWRSTYKTDGGGVLLNQCPHTLDILYYLFGMPNTIKAYCKVGKYHPIEVEDEVSALMKYDNMVGSFITSTGELPGTNKIDIAFDRAYVTVYKEYIEIYEIDKPEQYYRDQEDFTKPEIKYTKIEFKPNELYPLIFKNFKDAILGKENIKISGYESLMSLYMANAMYLSEWLGKDIEIHDISSDEIQKFLSIYDNELLKRQ